MEQAAEKQESAEERLGSGDAKAAAEEQQEAVDNLEAALKELEKEKRRIESLPPEALQQLAKDQRRTRDKTMELLEEMKKSPPTKSADDAGGEDGQPPSNPGEQQTGEAADAMKDAAEKMEQNDGQQAQKKQKQAKEKLREAMEEIEERLAQLREETREEKLARLESRFAEMLDRQRSASITTIELDDRKSNLSHVRRRDEVLVLRLATEEAEIAELSRQARDLLIEDGTSVVFPEVVLDLQSDLDSVADLLQQQRTGQYTQLVQREIESTIEDLIDALKKAQKEGDGGGGGGGGGGGKQPLLKKSAELKVLRIRQKRLNRRTAKIDSLRKNSDIGDELGKEIDNAAAAQRKILEMTEAIMESAEE